MNKTNNMETFGLIFVLYHPSETFLDNLAKARSVCSCIVAVDNSPDADVQLRENLRAQGMHVIFNRNRGGLAGAYNRGAEFLLARNIDVIFLLDQDTNIDTAFFDNMMQAASGLGTDTFLMGPKIYEINLKKCMPVFPPDKRFPKPVRMNDQHAGLFPTMCVISSGSAISAAAYRKLGHFREDYFIECVDVEYSMRAASRNVQVLMNAAVTIHQTTGQIERHGRLFTTNHAAWRRYYGARNTVHCLRLYRNRWSLHWLIEPLVLYWSFCVLLFDSDKLKKITAIACGYLDGVRGRLGTFEDLHPSVASFCKGSKLRRAAIGDDSTLTAEGGS